MEAIPRLPMLNFELKHSPEATSFQSLKRFIAECYDEDPETYTKEIYQLETLRSSAMRPVADVSGCSILKRYYSQLHSLNSRFPLLSEKEVLSFTWSDVHSNMISRSSDLKYEMASILYNIGCLHSVLGTNDARTTNEGMKLSCTHFQYGAWAFQQIKENYVAHLSNGDMSVDILTFMEQLCLAQAQECILEKSLSDNRKSGIVAKVTSQIITYYNSALASFMSGSKEGLLAELAESKTFKKWKRYVKFKILYLSSILLLYQGQQSEEQQKMGERVVLFQAAFDKLEECKKESKNMFNLEQVNDALTFLNDIVEAKRKNAKNENEFIYHEEIPDISQIPAVKGANLVNGIGFNVTDPDVLGEDIFHRIVPMKAHEASSLYSEEKASFMRKISSDVEEKNIELKTFMSSLNTDPIINYESICNNLKLPQELIDRCADINSKPNAIPDLIQSMAHLADICVDVETMLHEIRELLKEEEMHEKNYQKKTGGRASVHFGELNREFQKYQEAHAKAGESNETLRKAMGLHVSNLKILSQPLKDLQNNIPTIQFDVSINKDENFMKLKHLINKVNEMQTQRLHFYENLREAAIKDDITTQIVSLNDESNLENLFKKELAKHDKNVMLIEQNLTAQNNILKALTDCYALCAPTIKQLGDVKHKREQFFTSLIASYDVYEDLLGKSTKGLEFYKKLQTNIQKLLARVKGARDVQDEERHQRLKSTTKITNVTNDTNTTHSNVPKLKDYIGHKKNNLPSIRPNPLGSESTIPINNSSSYDNQPPPTYMASLNYPPVSNNYDNNQYYDNSQQNTNAGVGYTNPIYQNQQFNQPQPPPTYQTKQSTTTTTSTFNEPPPSYNQQQWDQTINSPGAQLNQMNLTNDSTPYNYSTTNYGNYQITANKQYVTGYDQSVYANQPNQVNTTTVDSNYGSYGSHPGYSYNQNTGEYQYASGYQVDSNLQQTNYYPQYTTAGGESNINNNNTQTTVSGPSAKYQYTTPSIQPAADQTISNQPGLNANNQITSDPSNYYTPQYGYHTGNTQTPDLLPPNNYQYNTLNPTNSSSYIQQPTNIASSYSIPMGQASSATSFSDTANQLNQYSTNPLTYMSSSHSSGTLTTNSGGPQYDNTNVYHAQNGLQQQYQSLSSQGYNSQYQVPETGIQNQYFASQYLPQQPVPFSQATDTQTQIQPNVVYPQPQEQQFNNQNINVQNIPTYQNQNQIPAQQNTIVQPSSIQQPANTVEHQNVQPSQPQAVQPQSIPTENFQTVQGNQIQPSQTIQSQPKQATQPQITKPKSSNIDLLSDIDFSFSSETLHQNIEVLKPDSIIDDGNKKISEILKPISIISTSKPSSVVNEIQSSNIELQNKNINDFILSAKNQDSNTNSHFSDRKSSFDNLSICSDISSDYWESASMKNENIDSNGKGLLRDDFLNCKTNPFDDPKLLKLFHKEIERLEKFMETMNIKTLNGTTPLDGKWKELQDLLVKDESKRTTTVAKLFPEKNRSVDCIPYDHSRVLLPTNTDDYINAAYIRELGSGCPQIIITQTPMSNTLEDFWSMIFSQKSRIVVCLHTTNELLDPFWPNELNKEITYGDYSITLLQQFDLSHCAENYIKLCKHNSDFQLNLSLIQIKTWIKNSASNILGISNNIITAYRQRVKELKKQTILTINCLTGSDRSGIISLGISTILATQTKRPILINITDVWYRLCTQRKGALRDIANLQLSLQVVLTHGHDLLNKRGIMTSYQMKLANQTKKSTDKEEINDPFSDLDPLWKLKPNKK